jgi:hypothetical protein
MSFLAPLYALGFLAVAGPIIFHLIRRRPKGEVPFSSLMFLTPSPPPPASRRKLDQLLLLLLRAAALLLLGLAFMRPFFREDTTSETAGAERRIVVLIDTSASMRRGELWKQTVANANAALADCRPTDRIALYAFDRQTRSILGFAESDQLEPQQRKAVALDRLNQLTPSWGGTALDQALIDSVGAILEANAGGKESKGKIVLVSDMQVGARLTELSGFEWPADVELELRTVADARGNAGLNLLIDRGNAERGKEAGLLRVRVTNDVDAKQEQFNLSWSGSTTSKTDVYVPPGETRVVKVPHPPAGTANQTLQLQGDAHEFDNTLHFAGSQQQELTVFFLGKDAADDVNGLRYFLERAWGETPERIVRVIARKPDDKLAAEEIRNSPLVVLTGTPNPEVIPVLDQYIKDGGTVLFVLTAANPLPAIAGATSRVVEEVSGDQNRYAMLRDIAFDHPLFAPLSGAQFGDFTKVHFWKHRRLTDEHLPGARVLARFDNGNPAVLEKTAGRGRLVIFASGWHPADSQLARSSKFVPLMIALLEMRVGRQPSATQYRVGDRIPMANGTTGVRKPDRTVVALAKDANVFEVTDQPGVYVFGTPAGPRPFAVNLDPAESLTAAATAETLEQFGCRLAKRNAETDAHEANQQQRNVELERNQSIWRVLMLAAIAVLLVETGLAGWRSRTGPQEVMKS